MAVDMTTVWVIAAPVEAVAGYAADPSNVPTWYANISSVEWLSPKPTQVGSKIAFVAPFMATMMNRENRKDLQRPAVVVAADRHGT